MKSPFVPRSTFDAAVSQRDERISELKGRLNRVEQELTVEKERMTDLMACRAIGQTVYGRIVPPSVSVEEDEPEKPATEDPATVRIPTALENDISEIGTRARGLARRADARSRAEIEEAERALALAQEVGRERAMAGNGNGNH